MMIDFNKAKAGLIIVDARKALIEVLERWGVECNHEEAEKVINGGSLTKHLIRKEYNERKGKEKKMAIQFEMSCKYRVSQELIKKVAMNKR